MAINNYTELTIPQGVVDKIEDANGNIIWGSQSKYPYRLLDYIDIPSGCYINTNEQGNSNLGYYLDVNLNINNDSISTDEYPFGSMYYNGTRYYRYHLILANTNGMRAAYGASGYTKLCDMSDSNQRHIIELDYHTYNDNRAYINDIDKGEFAPPTGTNTGVTFIGARRFNNNGTIVINDYQHTIRVYKLQSQTYTTALSIYYPVQRKSDGKVGLLKIYNDGAGVRFCTTETLVEPIAGNTVNEYITGTNWIN